MKKFITALILLLSLTSAFAQNTVRDGNNYRQQTSSRVSSKDTLVTSHLWYDAQNNAHAIILNKASGACYVWIKSKKGNYYKKYMESWVSAEIAAEYGISYVPRKRQSK